MSLASQKLNEKIEELYYKLFRAQLVGDEDTATRYRDLIDVLEAGESTMAKNKEGVRN